MNDIGPAPAIARTRPILVTGGAGFIGCNLADRLAAEGHHVLIYDSLVRPGVGENLAWLKRRHPGAISAMVADIRDESALREAASSAAAVFHLAAQVAVTTSLVDPREDFEVNVQGTLMLLDALRQRGDAVPFVFASTNKVYGELADVPLVDDGARYVPRDPALRAHGIGENRPISFHTPYGCSKGAADQYVLDFARSFGLPACVLRMSCIYGPRQRGTEDQGWVAHFLLRALQGKPITIYGDGRQVRDILFVDDAIDAYVAAWRRIGSVAGRAFNLGGGPENAVSLLDVIGGIEQRLAVAADVRFGQWRPGDQRYFVSDTRRAVAELGLRPPLHWREGVTALAASYHDQLGPSSRVAVGAA
ncbi:MAG: NAD-dependent epimerase/dehydratase family protein [Acetobacteraceae bacterium]|nr:NAD-dependent epimerase/dehydratase family protein [Acetobacteraceae bacterium]